MKIKFGIHKDKTINQILNIDPQYILWLHKNKIIKVPQDVVIMATKACEEPDYEQ